MTATGSPSIEPLSSSSVQSRATKPVPRRLAAVNLWQPGRDTTSFAGRSPRSQRNSTFTGTPSTAMRQCHPSPYRTSGSNPAWSSAISSEPKSRSGSVTNEMWMSTSVVPRWSGTASPWPRVRISGTSPPKTKSTTRSACWSSSATSSRSKASSASALASGERAVAKSEANELLADVLRGLLAAAAERTQVGVQPRSAPNGDPARSLRQLERELGGGPQLDPRPLLNLAESRLANCGGESALVNRGVRNVDVKDRD